MQGIHFCNGFDLNETQFYLYRIITQKSDNNIHFKKRIQNKYE